MSPQAADYRDLHKQVGCMKGILQIFDRQHFLTSRRKKNIHDQKMKLLQGVHYQMDPGYAKKAIKEQDLRRQEKSRISSESSQASYLSSSSSTFSLRDYNTERTSQIKPRKEQQPSSQYLQSAEKVSKIGFLELSVNPKSLADDGMRINKIKHVDSPRPVHSFQPKKHKTTAHERSDRTLLKVQGHRTKEERVLLPARFSYDGIELQKPPRLIPRLSLDSKVSSEKCSSPGTRSRSSSIVTKLMGLDVFPDYSIPVEISTPTVRSWYKEALLSQFISKNEGSKQNQVTGSPRVLKNGPTTPSRKFLDANSQKKTTQDIPKTCLQTKNDQENLRDKSFSIYGEIEKRVTELELRKPDKNLRALKQILDAMHKTKETTEKHGDTGESKLQMRSRREQRHFDQNANISALKNSKSNYLPKKQSETRDPKSRRVSGPSYLARNGKNNPPTSNKKADQRSSEPGRTLAIPQQMKAAPEKHPRKKLVEANHSNMKHQLKNTSLQLKDDRLREVASDTKYSSYQGDTTSLKSVSNSSVVSETETQILNVKQKRDSESADEHRPAVEITNTHEQPSPVSVLDDTFYSEDTPSPVKMTSRSFREDEIPMSAEADWGHNDLTSCRRSNGEYMSGQKLDFKSSASQQRLSIMETRETVGRQKALPYDTMNPDHTYVNKILSAIGVVKESSFIPTTDHLHSSIHVINPEMFHILEQTEDKMVKEIVHRKIIFDVVNEIMVRKIYSEVLTGEKRSMRKQSFLTEVYLEIDRICGVHKSNCTDERDQTTELLTADFMHKSEDWANDSSDIEDLILDIERLIFKDLINEIVIGEIALHDMSKHCRKLLRY